MPLVTLPAKRDTPHTPPSAFQFTGEGADTSGGTSFSIFPTMFIGDLMLAVFTVGDGIPDTFSINTPTAGSGGPWIQLFNGTMDTDDSHKTAVFARVAAATDFGAVTFSAGTVFAQACAEMYRVPAGSHNASSGSDVTIAATSEGSNVAAGTYPAATITNSRRLMYIGTYFGNNGNQHTPNTPTGFSLVNYNGGGDTSGSLFDFNDQTVGSKGSVGVTFPSANSDYKFFAITYP